MDIEKLNEMYSAPFVKRVLEIDPNKLDIVEASQKYAEEKKDRPTPCASYFFQKLVDNIRMVKVSTETTAANKKDVERLAWQVLTDDLDEQSKIDAIAKIGENIKISPVKKVDLAGNVTGYLQQEGLVAIVGLDVKQVMTDPENFASIFAEVIDTLAKNALCFHAEYVAHEKVTEHMPAFIKFFLDHKISCYDSIFESPITSFQPEERIMKNYLRFASDKLDKEMNLAQIQIIDLRSE